MYYRRKSYPEDGHSDIPDELWSEFQRIRGHLSSVDQNNVEARSVTRPKVASPTTLAREGVSDIVDLDGNFLYSERGDGTINVPSSGPGFVTLTAASDRRWYDLAKRGIVLRGRSRGDAPWLVGASVTASVTPSGLYGSGSSRGNLRLRVRSSSDGLSAAEAVGGFNRYCDCCSIATVACFLSRGGLVQFSPVVLFDQLHEGDGEEWSIKIHQANIFAVGLYR